jgi:hypothetical protein
MPMFADDVDETFWFLAHRAADMSSWVRRTEVNYFWGPGGSGKDTAYILSNITLGDHDEQGYCATLNGNYFLPTPGRKDLDTALDRCKHMRSITCNEIPIHNSLDWDFMKNISEMRGSGIVSRTIYKEPERWLPMGGVTLSGNHPLKLTNQQSTDTGIIRRLNVLKLRRAVAHREDDIKETLETDKDAFRYEMFWLARKLYGYLTRLPKDVTRLLPRPPSLVQETEEVLSPSQWEVLEAWVDEKLTTSFTYSSANSEAEIMAAILSDESIRAQG